MKIANSLASLLINESEQVSSGQGKTTRQIIQEQLDSVDAQLKQDRATLVSLSIDAPTPQIESRI